MKRSSIIYEILIFLLILVFLIIPPFFTPSIRQASAIFTWAFPWRQTCLCIFALVLYFFSRALNTYNKARLQFFYPSVLALALLFFVALIIKLVTKSYGKTISTTLPSYFSQWLFCILTFAVSATYEEIIYRFYFTDALKRLAHADSNSIIKWLCEFAGLLVFAFAHFYLGIPAIINAAFAHCILRVLYKKTGLIWNCVIVHFIYNIISLILL